MKKHFYTGLIVVLPLLVTFYIFNWFLKMVIRLISGTILTKIIRWILEMSFSGHTHEIQFQILTYLISIILIILFIALLGYTTKIVFFSKIMKKILDFIEKIPLIKTVYITAKQIIGILYSTEGEAAYKRVVAIEYPRKGMYAVGFMTSEKNEIMEKVFGEETVTNIFIPTSPNPTSGMLICVPKKDIKFLDMDTETAFKLIISGGYVTEESIKKLQKIKRESEGL